MTKFFFISPACQSNAARRRSRSRRASISVLAAVLMVVMIMAAAFAIDLGMICVAKGELQRSADAAAMAAANELLHQLQLNPSRPAEAVQAASPVVRGVAASTASLNEVFRQSPQLGLNSGNSPTGEILLGEMIRGNNGSASLSFQDSSRFNSVQVRIERTANQNGELPLFFGRLTGLNTVAAQAVAQAAFLHSFRGFRVPSGGDDPPATLMILPFAIDRPSWLAAQNGNGPDNFGWDSDRQAVQSQGDGVPDLNLFPLDTGSGGNFGTVDIGSNNSNTPTLRRQIVEGATRQDLAFHGGELALDNRGQLILSGDPGLKAGAIQPELRQIVGQTRIMPLYSSVTRNGNQAQFTIVGFVGCRILDVQLTGPAKHLTVQPAPMITRGGIPDDSGASSQIYSPVILVK